MNWLALDIGGANLKAADGRGYAASSRFALWKERGELVSKLRWLIAEAPPSDHLAVTMTGELADCFESQQEGVRFILEAVSQAADGRHTRVYLNDGRLVAPPAALRRPLLAATSNWHALARFAARYAPQGSGLLIDVGSTTVDLVPLLDGQLVALAAADTDRLLAGELVYTGVERSPLCAMVRTIPYRKQSCPVVQELFATALDVYLLLGDLPEDANNTHTADGRPATKAFARARLRRMICAPPEQFHHRDAVLMAAAAAEAQLSLITAAARRVIERLPGLPQTVVLSGQGEFLGLRVLQRLPQAPHIVSLSRQLGALASRCGPAHGLAVLAREAVER